MVSRTDGSYDVVETEIAAVRVVVRRRHQQCVVQVRVERRALQPHATGDLDAVQPLVPGVVCRPAYRIEARAVRGLAVEIVRCTCRVDVADADPYANSAVLARVEGDPSAGVPAGRVDRVRLDCCPGPRAVRREHSVEPRGEVDGDATRVRYVDTACQRPRIDDMQRGVLK